MTRLELSYLYIKGKGLEIAPLHSAWPLALTNEVQIQYCDRYSNEDLRAQYPEHNMHVLTPLQLIIDGQYLKEIEYDTLDFVISSHFIEHCEDPIQSLYSWLGVIKKGGYLLLATPDKNNPIDKNRGVTTWEHLFEDFKSWDIKERKVLHYEEYLKIVDGLHGRALQDRINACVKTDAHIHFHTWTYESWLEFLNKTKNLFLNHFSIEHVSLEGHEFLTVLKKL